MQKSIDNSLDIVQGATITDPVTGEERPAVRADISPKAIDDHVSHFLAGDYLMGDKKRIRDKLEYKIVRNVGRRGTKLLNILEELAEGIWTMQDMPCCNNMPVRYNERMKKNGEFVKYDAKVYKKEPNMAAIIYLFNLALGKSTTVDKFDSEREGVKTVEKIIRDMATGKEQVTREVEIRKSS